MKVLLKKEKSLSRKSFALKVNLKINIKEKRTKNERFVRQMDKKNGEKP